jgi:hypothetical protein
MGSSDPLTLDSQVAGRPAPLYPALSFMMLRETARETKSLRPLCRKQEFYYASRLRGDSHVGSTMSPGFTSLITNYYISLSRNDLSRIRLYLPLENVLLHKN